MEEHPCLETKEIDESTRFHGICIDVFDGANLMPPGFYSVPFLEKLRDNLLKTEGTCGFVIHNFHTSEPSGSSLSWRMLWNLTGMFLEPRGLFRLYVNIFETFSVPANFR